MNDPTLLQLLRDHCTGDTLPMHMPGHKRNTALAPYLDALGAGLDITEIPGFSNLHDPKGALAQRMTAAAKLWGSRRAWWLVGGSTAGLLAAVAAATAPGDEVLLARNCHKSVYNAAMLRDLRLHYLWPAPYPGQSFAGAVPPEAVTEALTEHPNSKLVILTSPTYEGIRSDIPAISDIVHRHGALLLVDEAHGAHLGLHPAFGPSAVTQGADLVVQSLHKTLPSLTQTGLLHLCSDRIDAAEISFQLSVFQTSSPSYLLMASMDSCVTLLAEQGDALFQNWADALAACRKATAELQHLTLPLAGDLMAEPSKLVISTRGTSVTGPELARRLRETHHIETEMAAADYLIAMTGMGDTKENLVRFAHALHVIDRSLSPTETPPPLSLPVAEQVCTIAQSTRQPTRLCNLADAPGEVSADFLWAYPPGIPLIAPGEQVSKELLDYIAACQAAGVELSVPYDVPDGMIRVLTVPRECCILFP